MNKLFWFTFVIVRENGTTEWNEHQFNLESTESLSLWKTLESLQLVQDISMELFVEIITLLILKQLVNVGEHNYHVRHWFFTI